MSLLLCYWVIAILGWWHPIHTTPNTQESGALWCDNLPNIFFCCKCLGSASKREGVRKRLKTSERWFDPALKYTSQYSGTNLTQSHPPWQIVGSANTLPLPISISLCKKRKQEAILIHNAYSRKWKKERAAKNIFSKSSKTHLFDTARVSAR